MGQLFRKTAELFEYSSPDQTIVEIGSDRYEGSTAFFAEQADKHQLWLHTIDIDGACAHRIRQTAAQYLDRIKFYQEDGMGWAANYYGPGIHTVYLDNFDWDWEPGHPNKMIEEQRAWYALKGIEMNNKNCQRNHYEQMVFLLPFMGVDSVVCLDDTYQHNGEWTGKGGLVVPFLEYNGYEILHNEDYGVILGSGKYTEKVI